METGISDRHLYRNLRWTDNGEVWATWHLTPLQPQVTPVAAAVVHWLHTNLWRGLAGHEVLLAGHLIWSDPTEVMGRMLVDVDLARADAWVRETEATIEQIADIPFGERRWMLHVRLNLPGSQRVRLWARTGFNRFAQSAGVMPFPPSNADVRSALVAMRDVEERIPVSFAPRRATEADMVWERRHAQNRGTTTLLDPQRTPDLTDELLPVSGRAALGNPLLDPGGLTELEGAAAKRPLERLRRRWLKVYTDLGTESWQAGLVLSVIPPGLAWPDTEFLGRIDEAGIPLDVGIRMSIRTRAESLRRNKRAMAQLNDQLDQVGQMDVDTMSHQLRLTNAAEVLAELQADIQSDDKEAEVAPIIMVSAASLVSGDDVDAQAAEFLNSDAATMFGWARPIGLEEDIFWAMQPGSMVTPRLRDYQQITTSTNFGETAPLMQHSLGTRSGILAGINESTALPSPWFIDLFGTTTQENQSPSLFVSGEQGAGKSMFLKKMAGAIVARGGRILTLDSTTTREWVKFASALEAEVEVVDLANPRVSADPLRILPVEEGSGAARAFVTTLLGLKPTEGEGLTVSQTLSPEYLSQSDISSLSDWLGHLQHGCTLPYASELASRVRVFLTLTEAAGSAGGMASALFDPRLPAMDISADAIVFGISNVVQPDPQEVDQAHLFRELPAEKLFGRATMAMIMGLAKAVLWRDKTEQTALIGDELHYVTRSAAALRALEEMLRYGRHVQGATLFGSHNPEADVPDTTVRGLIKNRLVMRTPDRELAKAGARFLGFEERSDDKESQAQFDMTVKTIRDLPPNRGMGMFRDHRGVIGRVRTLMPADPVFREAAISTPQAAARSSTAAGITLDDTVPDVNGADVNGADVNGADGLGSEGLGADGFGIEEVAP